MMALAWAWMMVKQKIIALFTLLAQHWRIVLPILAVLSLAWYIHNLRSNLADEKQAFSDYKAAIEKAYIDQVAENVRKQRESEANQIRIAWAYNGQIERIRSYYEPITHQQAVENGLLRESVDILDNRLRVEADSYRRRLSKLLEASSLSTESGRDSDSTVTGQNQYLAALEQACAVTTADYNALWEAWNSECEIRGCQ